ncbi:MAG TPA: DUF3467 domain-containing protein [Anaerolineales bacterium]|nr:DUF3467 domain-containing protein [Anaerolineales bacterium]
MSDQPEPTPKPAPQPAPQQVMLELPANLDPVYANFAIITHSPSEIVIDHARVMPNTPKSKVVARIILTPMNAKLFLRALTENLAKYETQYGEIIVPTGLADQLFKPPKPE